MTRSIIQRVHDSEINGGIAWPVDERILIYFGCPLEGIHYDESLVRSVAEAEAWLDKAASRYFPKYRPAADEAGMPPAERQCVIDKLYASGIGGGIYWIFDSAFGAALGDPDRTGMFDAQEGLSSWAEAQEWLSAEAARRHPDSMAALARESA